MTTFGEAVIWEQKKRIQELEAELKRYREREPLVQELLTAAANLITIEGCALPNEVQVRDLDEARMAVATFKVLASAAEGDESA